MISLHTLFEENEKREKIVERIKKTILGKYVLPVGSRGMNQEKTFIIQDFGWDRMYYMKVQIEGFAQEPNGPILSMFVRAVTPQLKYYGIKEVHVSFQNERGSVAHQLVDYTIQQRSSWNDGWVKI